MVKLDNVIQATIDKLNVDFDNILAALETALKYRNLNGFEVLSEIVNCRDGEDVDVLPHVGMTFTWRNGAKEARFVGVSAKITVTYEYESQLLSRSNPNDFISALYSCK